MENGIEILFLSEQDVEKCIDYKEAVRQSEKAYRYIGTNEATEDRSKFLKAGEVFLGWQGGYTPGSAGYQFMISLVRDRPQDAGLRAAYALSALFDPKTGVPLAVMSAVTHIRALKTGAASALAAKYLAKQNSHKLAIIGAGVIGKGQFLALREVLDIKEVKIFDISERSVGSFVKEMSEYGAKIEPADTIQNAMKGMDVVVVSTSADVPLIKREWLEEGMLLFKLGTDQELEPEILMEADKLVTDWWDYTMTVRSKELKILLDQGLVDETQIRNKELLYAELPELVMGVKRGRENDKEKIVSIQLGRSADYATCKTYVYERALELGLGQKFRLM